MDFHAFIHIALDTGYSMANEILCEHKNSRPIKIRFIRAISCQWRLHKTYSTNKENFKGK